MRLALGDLIVSALALWALCASIEAPYRDRFNFNRMPTSLGLGLLGPLLISLIINVKLP